MTEEEKKKNIGAIGFLEELKKTQTGKYAQEWLNASIKALEQEPYKDAYIQQLVAERNVAVEQLKKLGYELGEKIEPCKDAVSRQAVLDLVNSDWKYENLEEPIENLPSATPKKEKWIEDGYYGLPCVCSYCSHEGKRDMKICPNCKKEMEVEE